MTAPEPGAGEGVQRCARIVWLGALGWSAVLLRFARSEAHGSSPVYERLALAVRDDDRALRLLCSLPAGRAQPNLLFGVMRWHGVPVDDPAAALRWLHDHEEAARAELFARSTQTNEAGRCATLLPALAQLATCSDGPLALVEVGASAGLCLLLDAWRYRWTRADGSVHALGPADSPVELTCAVAGPVPLPTAVPAIAWRAGLDLHPVDASDADARRWLQCLVWPEHAARAERLRTALDVAAELRPPVRAGDMTRDLAPLLDEARHHLDRVAGRGRGTLVVTHSAALAYLDADARTAVRATIAAAGAHRLGAEGAAVLPDVQRRLPGDVDDDGRFVISLDDRSLAFAAPHGSTLTWL